MKQFLKYVLATVVGLLVTGAVLTVAGLATLGSLVAVGSATTEVTDGAVLRLRLTGEVTERVTENPLNTLMGADAEATGLDELLAAIRIAADDDRIAGIYLEGGVLLASPATLEELRDALVAFKRSGKFVVAYGDNYSQGAYYVASVADRVVLNPSGMLDWHGFAATPVFYKDLLEKVGVRMQVYRVGTYKSYVEPYTLTAMSEASRKQIDAYLRDIWSRICHEVAASRRVKVDSLNAYADRYTLLADARDYVRQGLVDTLAYVDGVRALLRQRVGTDKLTFVAPRDVVALEPERPDTESEIAVYYAHGDIVGTRIEGLGSTELIVAPDVVADLDRLASDDRVKAVVLRINSGGGSAYASEQMWRAVQLLKQRKPVVVSMGGTAASGAYYLACGAHCIYAEPTSLTGSIGIFGMIPDASGLLTDKLGLHFDVVKTNEASDFGTVGRPFNAAEGAAMQAYVDRGYALFLRRVAAGRGMKPQQVDSIAQGRVWTGRQAKAIGLVDYLGSLSDAVTHAALRAKTDDYTVKAYPARRPWYADMWADRGEGYFEQELRAALGSYYRPLVFLKSLQGTDCLQARLPYELNLH